MEYRSLMVGLGNPGPKYENTRHNLGFMVVDYMLALGEKRKSMRLEKIDESGDYELYKATIAGGRHLLAKPLTYMNLSGRAVSKICGRHGVDIAKVLVLHDELDLPLGRIKLKKGGGNNGHRGLESIEECMNSGAFLRLRLGIGRPENPHMDISDWVLDPFTDKDKELIQQVVEASFKGMNLFFRRGMGQAQQFLHPFIAE